MVERTRPPIVSRGSRQRLRQIRWRDNWSAEMSWLAIWIAIVLCLIIPWLVRNTDSAAVSPARGARQPTALTNDRP